MNADLYGWGLGLARLRGLPFFPAFLRAYAKVKTDGRFTRIVPGLETCFFVNFKQELVEVKMVIGDTPVFLS